MMNSVFPGDAVTAVMNVNNVTNNVNSFYVGVKSNELFSCTTRAGVAFVKFRKGPTNCFVVFYMYTMTCLIN